MILQNPSKQLSFRLLQMKPTIKSPLLTRELAFMLSSNAVLTELVLMALQLAQHVLLDANVNAKAAVTLVIL